MGLRNANEQQTGRKLVDDIHFDWDMWFSVDISAERDFFRVYRRL